MAEDLYKLTEIGGSAENRLGKPTGFGSWHNPKATILDPVMNPLQESVRVIYDEALVCHNEMAKRSASFLTQVGEAVNRGHISAAQGELLRKQLASTIRGGTEHLDKVTQELAAIHEGAEHLTEQLKTEWEARVSNSATVATVPSQVETRKFTDLLTRPQAVWNRMGWKGKTAVAVGVGAAVLATAYIVNRWRNGGEPDNAERMNSVHRHNYLHIANQLNAPQANRSL
jgi:hypothetical protein